MSIFIRRKEDKNLLKYLLPFGYMRRHLARAWGLRVVNGDFVSGTIAASDVSGFHLTDLLPLGVVMAMQKHGNGQTIPLRDESDDLREQFNRYREKTDREIERLSVECMRLEYILKRYEDNTR